MKSINNISNVFAEVKQDHTWSMIDKFPENVVKNCG